MSYNTAAADGAYNVLVQVDCDNNYEVLVDQITDEMNTIQRDALVPYVIANDDDVTTTRGLYQKLLIDIQMASCAKTSRIKEAIAATQLYLHRYFINLEDVDLETSDQQAAKESLKDQWQWMRNYRVWEANRKVFLYPENYIRPELRDSDTISSAFEALHESLSQGELTEDTVEEAYFQYLNSFTEVSELTIAGGYVYDDTDGDDKMLVLFGRTRTDPMRYFYRFATFINGDSNAITWDPWEELEIKIESTRVEPVFAFNRVFVFWTVLEEITSDNSSSLGTMTSTTEDDETQTVTSPDNSDTEYQIKVYYSFYDLNKRWSQPQLLTTEFDGDEELSSEDYISEDSIKLCVENSTNLNDYDYENIYIYVSYDTLAYSYSIEMGSGPFPNFPTLTKNTTTTTNEKAFNLMPELYSQSATVQSIDNPGEELFDTLFPDEGGIEDDDVVMLNATENSLDGPWFAYNHNGSGFLVKPDTASLSSEAWPQEISDPDEDDLSMPADADITAAVQGEDGDIYFFLKVEDTTSDAYETYNKTYVTLTSTDEGYKISEPADISSRWGIPPTTEMQLSGEIDSAFVVGESVYLTLDGNIYEYDGSFDLLVKEPYELKTLITNMPDWDNVDAAFTNSKDVTFWFNNETGTVLRGDAESGDDVSYIRNLFGLPSSSGSGLIDSAGSAAIVHDGNLHVVDGTTYTVYQSDGSELTGPTSRKMNAVLLYLSGPEMTDTPQGGWHVVKGMMSVNGGIWIRSKSKYNFLELEKDSDGNITGGTVKDITPSPFGSDSKDWTAGLNYTDSEGDVHHIIFYITYSKTSNYKAKSWTNSVNTATYDMGNIEVTAALASSDGSRLIIIADNTYYMFANTEKPEDILEQLQDGDNSGDLSDLDVDVYLGEGVSNNIWEDNKVDAACIGSDALYLFRGDQYFRFTADEDGEYSDTVDSGYPKYIESIQDDENFPYDDFPEWSQVDAAFTYGGVSYFFNNSSLEYYRDDTKKTSTTVDVWGVLYAPTSLMEDDQVFVDAAYCSNGYLNLIAGDELYRYTLDGSSIPDYIDTDYPKPLADNVSDIDAAFELGDYVYFFIGDEYCRMDATGNPSVSESLTDPSPITGNWGNIPSDIRSDGLTAAFSCTFSEEESLYFIQGDSYLKYTIADDEAAPYEINDVMYELIRLTSSTAEQLNQILFAGDIDDLLKMSTQEINESPTISFDDTSPDNIKMNKSKFSDEPVNSHLDFNSANGIYYWEIFFHAPFLIAQTLNEDQKFEYAKEWFEYIYDPTEVADYWKFLPFLAADPDALMATLADDLDNFEALIPDGEEYDDAREKVTTAKETREALADALEPFQDVFLGLATQSTVEASEGVLLADIESWDTFVAMAGDDDTTGSIADLDTDAASSASDKELLATWQSEMQEVLEIIKKLDYRIGLMDNYSAQLTEYLEDPFDPHAIAALRTIAYRKAIVMRYVDNLLDWGDMLFRQYTRESINEARMLYILAYDLLGEKPENMGQVVLEGTKTYADLSQHDDDDGYDFLIDLENSAGEADYEESLSFAATQHDSVTNPYFYLKENELFTEYWDRVEDRLGKIRDCLNIDGVAQPLPLFQPPIDPMALVNAAAGGGGAAAAAMAAGAAANVPDHRFDVLLAKARDLTGKLKSFGDNLLSTLEKKDSEELSLLQSKQESAMLELTTFLKEGQIKEAETSLLNLQESQLRAEEQETHSEGLISSGKLNEEQTQIDLMKAGAILNGVVALGRIVAGLAHVVPQITAGPFSFGVTTGGRNVGDMLGQFAEATQSGAEALSMGGEVAGVVAQYKRSKQDWELQKKMSTSEITQLDYEIAAQKIRIKMAQHELTMHNKDIENNEAIAKFMKSKFSNKQLYNWMSGKISGLFFQTYKMAHDYAKQAEQAFVFEKGVKAGEVNYISGMYWDSQKKGLLAGASLDLDLDRMEKAYMDTDTRCMEITKNISLLEMDPIALLQLKSKGYCNFRLSEELLDYDFPGHYNRQIKTISLAFDIGEGQFVNATLTQLNSKQVMSADIKAVKHLLDPANEANTNVRVNWRANQQIALSHVDQYTENNGMFELNFSDERYLPFEGTGAVSNWRLELSGRKGSYNPADLLDVTVKLRYTAQQGGKRFATEVKGLLKPYNATSFFDLAYNFPDEWQAVTTGDSNDVTISFTRDMFPNMSSSKIIGMVIRYQYESGDSGAIFTINDDLQVPNNTYLQPATLSIGQNGSDWKFTLKGDKTTLKNAEMVLVYKAKV